MTEEAHSVEWQVRIAALAYAFFSASGNEGCAKIIGKSVTPGQFTPLNGHDFVKYLEVADGQVSPMDNAPDIDRILRKMVDEGIFGTLPANLPLPILGTPLVLMSSLTQSQKSGFLYLSSVLGPRFLIPTIASATIPITGTNSKGDKRIGTGIALTDTDILTCAHVLTDMTPDDHVTSTEWIAPFQPNNQLPVTPTKFPITGTKSHPDIDVAVITVEPGATGLPHLGGLAARDPEWADTIHVVGYPPVPYSQQTTTNAHTGEVIQPAFATYDNRDLFLFSATARPGNSGGPIVASDGRLVGIVTRELSDKFQPESLPFYSGVPVRAIMQALLDLGVGHLLHLETWAR